MEEVKEVLTFNLEEIEVGDLEEFAEHLFWKDLYIHQMDTLYLHDSHNNEWYNIEMKYNYVSDFDALVEANVFSFVLIDKEEEPDVIEELEDWFL